jgi:hypothetical protein
MSEFASGSANVSPGGLGFYPPLGLSAAPVASSRGVRAQATTEEACPRPLNCEAADLEEILKESGACGVRGPQHLSFFWAGLSLRRSFCTHNC